MMSDDDGMDRTIDVPAQIVEMSHGKRASMGNWKHSLAFHMPSQVHSTRFAIYMRNELNVSVFSLTCPSTSKCIACGAR